MDILYKLPFPQEVCSKIFMFACKSPHHNTLGSVAIKHIIRFELYDKVMAKGGIVLDSDRNVMMFSIISFHNDRWCLMEEERKRMNFNIFHLKTLMKLTLISALLLSMGTLPT